MRKGSTPTASLSSNSSFKMDEGENEDVQNSESPRGNKDISLKDIVLVLPSPSPNRNRYYSDDNFDDASSFCSSVSGSIDISGHSTDGFRSPQSLKNKGASKTSSTQEEDQAVTPPPPPPPPYLFETPPPPLAPYTPISSSCNTPCSSKSEQAGPRRKPRKSRNRDLAMSPSAESLGNSVVSESSASESCRWGNCSSSRKDSFPTLSPGIHRKRPATLRHSFEEKDKAPTCNRSTRGNRTANTSSREERRKERQERKNTAARGNKSLDKTAANAMAMLSPNTRDAIMMQDLFITPPCSNRSNNKSKNNLMLAKVSPMETPPLSNISSASPPQPPASFAASKATCVNEALRLMMEGQPTMEDVKTPVLYRKSRKAARGDAIPTPPMRGRSMKDDSKTSSREMTKSSHAVEQPPTSPFAVQIL